MSEEELEIYNPATSNQHKLGTLFSKKELKNPATSDQHKLGTLFSKKELKILALVNLFFIIFTIIFYSQYVKKYQMK